MRRQWCTMATVGLGSNLALCTWLCVAAVNSACGSSDLRRVGTMGDVGSAGAQDSATGGSAGAVGQDGGTGKEQGGETNATGGRTGETGAAAGEAGRSWSAAQPSCANGVRDGTETDVDCGGPACAGCASGDRCTATRDCKSGICRQGVCSVESSPACKDGIENGDETDLDCGGGTCPTCADGQKCVVAADCRSASCNGGRCGGNSCANGVKDGEETGVDCGGQVCAKCEAGNGCRAPADCVDSACTDGICAFASCTDGISNGDETDVDCGGEWCPACKRGSGCRVAEDCVAGTCTGGICRSVTCTDGVLNGDETDIDCGGGCRRCQNGQTCAAAADCAELVCELGVCAEASCQDGVNNGDETDLDCGGSACPACLEGRSCVLPPDCQSSVCDLGVCAEATCQDGDKNGDETDFDCGGGVCPACLEGQSCKLEADCDGGQCFLGVCLASPVASRQTVTFRVHNGADSARELQVEGYLCSAFAIYRLEAGKTTLVSREVHFEYAPCALGDVWATSQLALMVPDASYELSWDVREEAVTWVETTCDALYPDSPDATSNSVSVPVGVARPVEPGEYRVDIAYLVGIPNEVDCFADEAGDHCVEADYDLWGVGEICDVPGLERMSVPFELPETGDVVVDIELG